MRSIRLVLRLVAHRIYSMLTGDGFGACPRCGWLFCYRFARGCDWNRSLTRGDLTCCPGDTVLGEPLMEVIYNGRL